MPLLIAVVFGFVVLTGVVAPVWFNRTLAKALKQGPPPPKFKYIVNPGADWEADELKAYLLDQGKRLEPDRKGIAT